MNGCSATWEQSERGHMFDTSRGINECVKAECRKKTRKLKNARLMMAVCSTLWKGLCLRLDKSWATIFVYYHYYFFLQQTHLFPAHTLRDPRHRLGTRPMLPKCHRNSAAVREDRRKWVVVFFFSSDTFKMFPTTWISAHIVSRLCSLRKQTASTVVLLCTTLAFKWFVKTTHKKVAKYSCFCLCLCKHRGRERVNPQ